MFCSNQFELVFDKIIETKFHHQNDLIIIYKKMITAIKPQTQSLVQDFLELSETKPASEFINGKTYQKPIPQFQHSRIQGKLYQAINQIGEDTKVSCAFSELRCTFANQSIVPDIAVIRWVKIPFDDTGKITNRFDNYPDWCIEILSPLQSLTQVLNKLLICSREGTEISWLINAEEEIILVVFPEQKIELYQNDQVLPVLEGIDLTLTPDIIFNWLKFN